MNSNKVFLVSLYDKAPYEDWIQEVARRGNYRFVGTEGTASWCRSLGVECETISDVFGLQPRLDGKVKSLNPDLYTGIMAEQAGELPEGIPNVTGVAVDLTPYRTDGEFRSGKVDIGGPALIRAAAKSWSGVTVVSSPESAGFHRKNFPLDRSDRRKLASMAIRRTLRYDHELLPEIEAEPGRFDVERRLGLSSVAELRYGENPEQDADWGKDLFDLTNRPFERLTGDELSYTNCLDVESARRLAAPSDDLQVSVIKHTNPTGWARGKDPFEVVRKAWEGDPKSAFGSVVGINHEVTGGMLDALEDCFVVGIVAPDFTTSALERLEAEGSTRALKWTQSWGTRPDTTVRSLTGGYLIQNNSPDLEEPSSWESVGEETVTDRERGALRQHWRLCRWVTSNAVVLGTQQQVLGVGAGQQSRVDAVRLAVNKYREFHDQQREVLVMVSDGFFPFPDNVEVAAEIGVDAIASPGGSKRDEEVLEEANQRNIGMIFTGTRAFYH